LRNNSSAKVIELSNLELLDEVEAEMTRLRAKNRRLATSLAKAEEQINLLQKQIESLSELEKKVKQKKERPTRHTTEKRPRPAPSRKALGQGLGQLFKRRH
jgi:predicted  nucleic acid-binding Zn-ribbon protein